MAATRGRDNERELSLRSELHKRGLRFRVHYEVPGNRRRSIDIAFPAKRVAVFLDGCFWHGCPQHGTVPSTNQAWWIAKIEANKNRDADTDRLLQLAGWTVVRIWAHTTLQDACLYVVQALGRADSPR
jgi:DNA mismatch endonuclease (patch repair protein)